MTRVSTGEGWNSALLNLMNAQQRQFDAQNRVSSEKVATDLKGYGRSSETLTAFKSAQARLNGFVANGEAVASRLTSQDLGLTSLAEAADGVRQAINDALASGRADALMVDIEGRFQSAVDALNAKHEGRFLFAGGRTDTKPVNVETLADLAAAPTVAGVFVNDQLKAASRLDDFTVVETGFLANELGTDVLTAFKAVQQFQQTEPFNGQLSATQRAFLEGIVGSFQQSHEDITNNAARNGALQTRVDTHVASQKDQVDSLQEIIGKRTDVDMAEAITKLQQAQLSVQASAQVIAQLRGVSLLDLLQP
ncbi:MAG: flagellin [Caulobacteraceae bacterium]|nr:flagellin [Caulobacteraceae bacterium]